MRIQNNIMALNTHRQYTIQNDKVSASAEKLSSGYRINRAADDAAGLAISEKMRSQIRGLNQSVRNSQDGASLIQTAEGALQEVHSMLQRMNELADQSATGTNAEFDRTQIAKEFDQLKREINDIAEQTTFNNMKILDGSLSVQGFQRSATTVGLYATSLGDMPEVNAILKTTPSVEEAQPASGTFALDELDFTTSANADGDFNDTTLKVSISIGGTTVTSGPVTIGASDDGKVTAEELGAAFDNAQFEMDGAKFTLKDNGDGTVTINSVENTPLGTDWDNLTIDGTQIQIVKFETADADDSPRTALETDSGTAAGVIDTALAEDLTDTQDGSAGKRAANYDIDVSKLLIGDTITLGDKTYELVNTLVDTKEGNIGIVWKEGDATNGGVTRDLATLVAGMAGANAPSGVDVTVDTDPVTTNQTIKVIQSAPDTDSKISMIHNSTASQGTQVEFDLAKMKEGDTVTVVADGTEFNAVFRAGDSVSDIFDKLGLRSAGTEENVYVKDNSIILKEIVADVKFEGVQAPNDSYGTMRIQVGALEGEQLNIEVKAMNTAGLGLDGFHIRDQDSAGKAITAVRAAIDVVSDQRALLGAMQNRMTYKINNLKIASENLQASESRIRDVDIASEMTQFTKSNILGQAATAMLAQANSAPQNVLSLLR